MTVEVPNGLVDHFTDRLQTALVRHAPDRRLSALDGRRTVAAELLQGLFRMEDDRRMGESLEPLGEEVEERIRAAVFARLFAFGPLQPYLDPGSGVSELSINGFDETWATYVDGTRERVPALFDTDADLVQLVEKFARNATPEKHWSTTFPFLEMDLPNGDRLSAAREVVPRPIVSIRRHDLLRLATLDDLVTVGMLDGAARDFLEAVVLARKNLVISGGTGAGKTTLLRAVANAVPRRERIITIEDVPELHLRRFPDLHDQVVEMSRRGPNSDGRGEVDMAMLVRASLRHSPDRVFLGEARGTESEPWVLALSQGNEGSGASVHAQSAKAAPRRIQGYCTTWNHSQSAWKIRDAVDFFAHVRFDRTNNVRRLESICQVSGVEGEHVLLDEVFAPDEARVARRTRRPLREDLLHDLLDAGVDRDAVRAAS